MSTYNQLPPLQPPTTRPPLPPIFQPPPPQPTSLAGGLSAVIYGPAGAGKTSFAAQFGRTVWAIDSQERGILYLLQRNLVPPPVSIEEFGYHHSSWKKLLKYISAQAARQDYDTLVVESISGLQSICFLDHGKRRFASGEYPEGDFTNGPNGFYSYSKGPKNAAQFDWPDFMEAVNLVIKSGKNVIITGHSSDKQYTNVFGEVYQKVIPACEEQIWLKLSRWASIVGLLTTREEQDRQKSRGNLKKTARPDMQRYLYTEATPFFEAKNWWGMRTTVIDAGHSGQELHRNFMAALMGN